MIERCRIEARGFHTLAVELHRVVRMLEQAPQGRAAPVEPGLHGGGRGLGDGGDVGHRQVVNVEQDDGQPVALRQGPDGVLDALLAGRAIRGQIEGAAEVRQVASAESALR